MQHLVIHLGKESPRCSVRLGRVAKRQLLRVYSLGPLLVVVHGLCDSIMSPLLMGDHAGRHMPVLVGPGGGARL